MSGGQSRRIRVLRDSVARQIAAGEVIDRPQSVVRELLDNSIDAAAASIDVHTDAGGVRSIRVVDNGSGMSRQDLDLCWHSHATSKIEQMEDLDSLSSLGFRGEALSSIAACSRLTITSKTAEESTAHRLRVDSGKLVSLSESQGETGTLVDVADLFYALPGRRRFLKTPSAETALCRAVLVEKSLPFPNIAFRFFTGGEMKLFLPASSTLEERVVAAHPQVVDPGLLHRVESRGEGFSISVIMGGPSLYRRDRRYIWSFVNNRRINEFALTQAVQFGFADHIPGGNFPIAFLFISLDPELVDFNVHPAKREARFRNLPELHHALVTALKSYLGSFSVSFGGRPSGSGRIESPPEGGEVREPSIPEHPFHGSPARRAASEIRNGEAMGPGIRRPSHPLPGSLSDISMELTPPPVAPELGNIRYFGQVFKLFLLASVDDRLFIIDQHAAHERVLFEHLRQEPGPPQKLLVPIEFEVTPDEERSIEANAGVCADAGIEIRRANPGHWEVLSLPEGFHSLEEEVIAFAKQARGGKRELEQELYARMSCRSAIKEGDSIDEVTAVALIKATFELENARCPHGRPIWYELSKQELYHLVGRL